MFIHVHVLYNFDIHKYVQSANILWGATSENVSYIMCEMPSKPALSQPLKPFQFYIVPQDYPCQLCLDL